MEIQLQPPSFILQMLRIPFANISAKFIPNKCVFICASLELGCTELAIFLGQKTGYEFIPSICHQKIKNVGIGKKLAECGSDSFT